MVRDVTGEIPVPAWPAGIELRPLDPARDGPGVHAALDEAFALEWGYERREYGEWAARAFAGERFDHAELPADVVSSLVTTPALARSGPLVIMSQQ